MILKKKVAIGLRAYEKNRDALVQKMRFMDNVPWDVVHKVFVAVNIEKDKSGAIEYISENWPKEKCEAFPVQPWFKVGVPALNAMVHKATAEGFSHIWFVSTRLVINKKITHSLLKECDERTLVAGAIMPWNVLSSDLFSICSGDTCPSNTCAIWNLKFLHMTGFPLITEMPTMPHMAGVEEVLTVSMQQLLFHAPFRLAKLMKVPGIETQTDHWDDERVARHEGLVSTKKIRSDAQFELLYCVKPGIIDNTYANN